MTGLLAVLLLLAGFQATPATGKFPASGSVSHTHPYFSLTPPYSVPPASDRPGHSRWGPSGHRVVGFIAGEYLTPKAREQIHRILDGDSLSVAGTWMDEIRSDPQYDHTHSWHWVTIPPGMSYEETEKNPEGDLIGTLERLIAELEAGGMDGRTEGEHLRMVIHLVGDIHQPLHVGTGEDRGGNHVRLRWFGKASNLHRVWDSQMIDEMKMSHTKLARSILNPDGQQISRWQRSTVRDWAHETMELREDLYKLPKNRTIGPDYFRRHRETVERQLLKAGIRLAGLLNRMYG